MSGENDWSIYENNLCIRFWWSGRITGECCERYWNDVYTHHYFLYEKELFVITAKKKEHRITSEELSLFQWSFSTRNNKEDLHVSTNDAIDAKCYEKMKCMRMRKLFDSNSETSIVTCSTLLLNRAGDLLMLCELFTRDWKSLREKWIYNCYEYHFKEKMHYNGPLLFYSESEDMLKIANQSCVCGEQLFTLIGRKEKANNKPTNMNWWLTITLHFLISNNVYHCVQCAFFLVHGIVILVGLIVCFFFSTNQSEQLLSTDRWLIDNLQHVFRVEEQRSIVMHFSLKWYS